VRKIIIIAFLILAAAVAGILLVQNSRPDTDVTAKVTKVGLILHGTHWDQNYCQSHHEALLSLRDELNLEIVCRDTVSDRDCYRVITELIEKEGCEIIVAVSYEFDEPMEKAAAEHPSVYFLHATGMGSRGNLSSFFGRMYQARYLAGIVAGFQTETKELGYVAALPFPESIRGINAFTLGVRSVCPDAVVHVRYCGSWTEDAPALRACRDLLDNHPIDVVIVHTNSLCPQKETDARGVWSIGCNFDNAGEFPRTYLTSSVWRWDRYYRQRIWDCLRGKFHGDHTWLGMDDGVVALSELTPNVDVRAKAAVEAASEKFQSREFDVFYGPIVDNEGNLRVDTGESMSDDEMLDGLDWYVEGVAVEQ